MCLFYGIRNIIHYLVLNALCIVLLSSFSISPFGAYICLCVCVSIGVWLKDKHMYTNTRALSLTYIHIISTYYVFRIVAQIYSINNCRLECIAEFSYLRPKFPFCRFSKIVGLIGKEIQYRRRCRRHLYCYSSPVLSVILYVHVSVCVCCATTCIMCAPQAIKLKAAKTQCKTSKEFYTLSCTIL